MKNADLIAKLEAATEGSLYLDQYIWEAKEGVEGTHSSVAARVVSRAFPPYTTSLDAALMLVPEGWAWIVEDTVWRDGSSGREGIGACVWNCSEKPPIRRAETPPLALCIACLRAIEHDQNAS
jgi:hypothetical protein